MADVLGIQLQTRNQRNRHAVLFLQLIGEVHGTLGRGVDGIENHGKGLAERFELADDALLGFNVALPRNVPDAAVGCDQHTDCRMLGNDLVRAHLGSLHKGHGLLLPGRAHHTRLPVFNGAERLRHDVAHAINHFDAQGSAIVDLNGHSLVGNEFGLGGHDRLARSRLRHFVTRTLTRVSFANVGKHEGFHKAFDKGGLPGTYGADDPDIDVAARTLGNILINGMFRHTYASSPVLFRYNV